MTVLKRFDKSHFNSIYKGTVSFCDTPYFEKFLELLANEQMLEHIKFANDYLGIPPVKSMISYYRKKEGFFTEEMKRQDKQSLGACFGYLYQYIYTGYKPKSVWVGDDGDKDTGIKTASVFEKEAKE